MLGLFSQSPDSKVFKYQDIDYKGDRYVIPNPQGPFSNSYLKDSKVEVINRHFIFHLDSWSYAVLGLDRIFCWRI
jgi:hypothetical protein